MDPSKERTLLDPLRNPDLFGDAPSTTVKPAASIVVQQFDLFGDAPDASSAPAKNTASDLFAASTSKAKTLTSLFGDLTPVDVVVKKPKPFRQEEPVDEPEVPHAVHSAHATTVVAASAARGARAAAPGPKVSLFDDDSKDVLGGDRDLQNVFIPQEAVEQRHPGEEARGGVDADLLEMPSDDVLRRLAPSAAHKTSSTAHGAAGAAGKSSELQVDLDDDLFSMVDKPATRDAPEASVNVADFDFNSYINQNAQQAQSKGASLFD